MNDSVVWTLKTLCRFGHYHLFATCLKRHYIGLGIEIGPEYKSEHFCTRDVNIQIGFYYFTFWIEDTK